MINDHQPNQNQPRNLASEPPHLIMEFGRARLLETPEGKLIVQGGTKADHVEVKEYVSLFMHEASISFVA